ncbi:MAG: hypothetical protein ACRED8_08855 [Caulobacteraceae bacterium]
MERLMVVGCSGAGKSTLARRLGDRLDLPVFHLDSLFWKPGWKESDREEFRARIAEAAAGEKWIFDGGYITHAVPAFRRAELIIWLDLPRRVCLARAVARSIFGFGRVREDLAPGCPEKIDLGFYRYIWNWDRSNRPRLEAALAENASGARLVRLADDKAVERFVGRLAS